MDRRFGHLLVLAALGTLLFATTAHGANVTATQPATPQAAPAVAPPATPQVAAACARQVAAAAATADETTHVPHGQLELSGCVSDTSGIDHVVVRWNQGDEHGRICTDPVVVEGQWRCAWDTTRLPSGKYELELIAVDAAGNRGSSTRKYEIDDRQQEPTQPPTLAPTDPVPAPPTAPMPSEPAPPTDPEPVPVQPTQPVPAEPEFSALQRLVIERVEACDKGGVDGHDTDDATVTTHHEQLQRVLDCLTPALELAGASSSRVVDEPPLELVVLVETESDAARDELDAALPDTIAGVDVVVATPQPETPAN